MSVKWIDRCLVLSPYSIGLCRSEEDYIRVLKKLKLPKKDWEPWLKSTSDAAVHFFEMSKSKALCCVVCFNNKSEDKTVIAGLMAHEAEHIWRNIKETLGEREPSVEFEALAMQSITQHLLGAFYD